MKKEKEEKREFMTIKQVASELNVSQVTVRNMIRDHLIAGIRVGKKVLRVEKAELEDYINQQSEENPYE